MTKKPLKKKYNMHDGTAVSYYLFKHSNKYVPAASQFVNRYYVRIGKFVYVPDLFFSHLENYSYFEDVYISENDNGEWLDEMLFQAEEERIAQEIQDLDDKDEEYQFEAFDSEQLAQDIQEAIENEQKENYFYSKDSTLKQMTIDNEIFMIKKMDQGFIATHVNENQIQRLFYDWNFRVFRREIWNTSATENKENEIYEYSGDDLKPYSKIIEKLTANPITVEYVSYNSDFRVSKTELYAVIKEMRDDGREKIRQEIISKSEWEYDDNSRVIKTYNREYKYSDSTYLKQIDVFEKKYVYMYHNAVFSEENENQEEEIPADNEYYEDNVLRMRLTYKDKLNYTKQYFFDDDYNISSYYVDNKLSKEIYRIGRKVVRIKEYDN